MKTLSLLVLVVLVGGCSTYGTENVDALQGGQTIAVISLLPGHANVPTIGTTMFNNSYKKLSSQKWEVNDAVAEETRTLLKQAGKFKVVNPDIGGLESQSGIAMANDASIAGSVALRKGTVTLKRLVDATQADLVLIIGTGNVSDTFMNSNDYVSGYGVIQRSFLGMRHAKSYVVMYMWLISAKTHDQIAQALARKGMRRADNYWIGGADSFTPANEDYTRNQIQQLLDKAVKNDLTSLDLAPVVKGA